MRKQYDLTGKKFHKWKAIRLSDYRQGSSGDRFWLCRCKCGLEKPVKACYLKSGTSRQCTKCAHEASKIKRPMPVSFWTHLKHTANKRGLKLSISRKYVLELLCKQQHQCALSGLPIVFAITESEHKAGKTTASIDRIDSNLGYTKDNIQMVHKVINLMKNALSQSEFVFYCKNVTRMSSTQT